MKQKVFIVIAFVVLLSCNGNPEKTITYNKVTTDSVATEKINTCTETSECYINKKNKDSMGLTLTIKNNLVTGNMNYQIMGKDKNKGTLQGEMRGDTLFADYTFWSEGIQSVRQVAYLKKDSSLLEGYGDVEEKGNKIVFKNTSVLNFGKGVVLQKTACQQ
jgi:hypothetical protein